MSEIDRYDLSFESLGLPDELLQGVKLAGFTQCTPIQALSLPAALAGQDVLGQAQTGTGKSAVFLLATMNALLGKPATAHRKINQPRAVIIAPTRELAMQIDRDGEKLAQATGLTFGVIYGGAGYEQQKRMFETGVDILVGTPGRMIDYFKQKVFDFRAIEVVVLDEADRMFDLGFIDDIRYLLRRMPKPAKRLSMLFSATLSYRVKELSYEHMNNPIEVEIQPDQKTVERIRQCVYYTGTSEKIPLLLGLLRRKDFKRTILFVNTKHCGERVAAYLQSNGIDGAVISGDVVQTRRIQLLKQFSAGQLAILVATDVAARGLHIPDVSHVINYDLPFDPKDYVHRIGRTARAGNAGDAISFACEQYAYHLPDIERYIGYKLPNEVIQAQWLADNIKPPTHVRRRRQRPSASTKRGVPTPKHRRRRLSSTQNQR